MEEVTSIKPTFELTYSGLNRLNQPGKSGFQNIGLNSQQVKFDG
jgi:hypothetical protein